MTSIRRISVLALSFFGIVDTVYLIQHALSGTSVVCSINGYDGCDIVDKSIYSHLFGIPLSVYGFLFYTTLFILVAITFIWASSYVEKGIRAMAVIGVSASIIFIWIQAYLIKAFCIYCVFSAILTVFIVFIVFWRKRKKISISSIISNSTKISSK